MHNIFLSQILICFLDSICLLRIFFTKNSKIDAATVLAPLAFFVSIFNICIFGFSTLNFCYFALSLLIFLTNVRSLFRLSAQLFVDRYSFLFISFTILELILIVVLFAFSFFYRPVKILPEKFNSSEKTERLFGSYERGFNIQSNSDFNQKTTGFLWTFEQIQNSTENDDSQKPIILFAASAAGEVQDYEPLLLFLSQKGYKVLAADFYSKDIAYFDEIKNSRIFRKFFALQTLFNSQDKNQFEEITAQNSIRAYKSLIKIAQKSYSDNRDFLILADKLSFDSFTELTSEFDHLNFDIFSINLIDEYTTSGFGFVEQSNIFLARKFNLHRDKTFFIPRYVSNKIDEEIKLKQY